MKASELLRAGLLEGVSLLLAAPPARGQRGGSLAAAIDSVCSELGADVARCEVTYGEGSEQAAMDEAVQHALAGTERLELLVVDAAGLFERESEDDRAALGACLQATWSVTRAVVSMVFLPAQKGGRIIYLAPAPSAGPHAGAARAGLENLARTLSIEWARHQITTVAIVPGESTSPGEVAALTAYLASAAGAYFSGCLLDLRGPRPV